MKKFLQSWAINTFAVLIAVNVVPGIDYHGEWLSLLAASLVLGILNAIVRPILFFLTLPLLIFTLGLFRFVINGLLLYFVGSLLQPHFSVDGFWVAFKGAFIISLVSVILNTLTGTGDSRVRFQRRRPPPGSGPSGGGGPVIDI